MLKKIFFMIAFCTLANCEYKPIYSYKDKPSVLIKDYELSGNKTLNRQILSSLNLRKLEDYETGYKLILNSDKSLSVISKDTTGNASIYKITIISKIHLKENNKIIKTKNFRSSFTYNNIDNKSDLANYQRNIEKNLIDKISEEILIFLSI